MGKNALAFYLLIPTLLLGGIVGWFFQIHYAASVPSRLREIRENSDKYHYINPLLFIETQRAAPEYSGLKTLLQKNIDTAKAAGNASSVSVYFRDLNTARWNGIDENHIYEPGSMLKVLTLITYLKHAETDPASLNKRLQYVSTDDPGQFYKPENPLPSGSYSIEKLLENMIIYSDNVAALTLLGNDKTGFIDTYNKLELPQIPTSSTEDFMSPKSYSALFRTLYNASYLSRDLSEQALFLLTNTTFKKGLVAGVPEGTAVAHKFGENTTKTRTGTITSRELHDCGIVYYPSDPYFLCIMTKGTDFPKLESIISSLSKTVYDTIDKENKNH